MAGTHFWISPIVLLTIFAFSTPASLDFNVSENGVSISECANEFLCPGKPAFIALVVGGSLLFLGLVGLCCYCCCCRCCCKREPQYYANTTIIQSPAASSYPSPSHTALVTLPSNTRDPGIANPGYDKLSKDSVPPPYYPGSCAA